ncbi:oocyte zinc finger protein XlCOF6-like [Thrips palmi]|uniref:Oocyte zinc finger protein XlCOF6-like n=1 Tax=Thrips palmi TaxID=161013 RepID=A0A6P9A778_THRPL|nr:oocyte zinc finger protein XlCOF6-like [Thrips palmi]
MCKSDEYEPYMTLETPVASSDPDAVLWEPATVGSEGSGELWKTLSAADAAEAVEAVGGYDMPAAEVWEPPPPASSTDELLWESSTLSNGSVLWGSAVLNDANLATWEPSNDANTSGEWPWKAPVDASQPGHESAGHSGGAANGEGEWKPSYVVNDSSDGVWKHSTDGGQDWKPDIEDLWKASAVPAVPAGPVVPTETIWDSTFASNGGDLLDLSSYATNGGSGALWDGAAVAWCDQGGEEPQVLQDIRYFCCKQCNTVFQSPEGLEEHVSSQHDVKTPKARHAPKEAKGAKVSKAPKSPSIQSTPNAEGKYPCTLCYRVLANPYSLRRHYEVHGKGDTTNYSIGRSPAPLHCTECPKTFTTPYSMRRHFETHGKGAYHEVYGRHQRKQFRQSVHACPECPKKFTTPFAVRRHYPCHGKGPWPWPFKDDDDDGEEGDDVKPIVLACDECPKTFASDGELMAHSEIHKEGAAYACGQCGQTYTTLSDLNRHKTRTHERRFDCTLCPRRFGFRNELSRHMSTHNVKTLLCSMCEKTCANHHYLSKHYRRIHRVTHPYMCVGCGEIFRSPAKLEHHQKKVCSNSAAGSLGPGFACPTCGVRFAEERSLGNHLLDHVKGEGDEHDLSQREFFKCATCGQACPDRKALRAHRQTHELLFCTDCEKSCDSEGSLALHCRTRHPVEQAEQAEKFSCTVCLHAFEQHGDLLQHLKRHLGR